MADIKAILSGPWKNFVETNCHFAGTNSDATPAQKWYKRVGRQKVTEAENQILEQLDNFENFDPWLYSYLSCSGHCTLSLKIALWALHWSFQNTIPTCGVPPWLPCWLFRRCHGYRTITWTAVIGADADTYGAIAGALLAAYHPKQIPKNMAAALLVLPEINQIFESLAGNKESSTSETSTTTTTTTRGRSNSDTVMTDCDWLYYVFRFY